MQDPLESWDEEEAAAPFCLLPTRRFPGDNHTQQQPVGSPARAPSAPTHPQKNLPSQALTPPPVTELLLTQIPRELSLLPKMFWFFSTLMRFGKGDLNVLHSRGFPLSHPLVFWGLPEQPQPPPQLLWLFQSPHSDGNRYSSAVEQVLEASRQH